jgi:hypothetical protein
MGIRERERERKIHQDYEGRKTIGDAWGHLDNDDISSMFPTHAY